jgi:ADP-ribosylglycohydrolase
MKKYRQENLNKINYQNPIFGTIVGDVIGSIYEARNIKTKQFELFCVGSEFTDDTVLTIAILDSILNEIPYQQTVHKYGNDYIRRGFGKSFREWLKTDGSLPYNSYGNGSAMRVFAIGYYETSLKEVLIESKKSAEITHNHVEGIKGAQCVASVIYFLKIGKSKNFIRNFVQKYFYDLNFSIDGIRESYIFDVSCQGSVPQAIVAFLESSGFEDAIRNAISIGGDSDTIAAITGGIAAAYYKEIPKFMIKETLERLPKQFIELLNKI